MDRLQNEPAYGLYQCEHQHQHPPLRFAAVAMRPDEGRRSQQSARINDSGNGEPDEGVQTETSTVIHNS